MALEKVSPPSSRYFRDLREVPPDEISVIKSETLLNNTSSDEVRVLNPIANTISYK
jgi:hypothetical protein